MKTRNEHHMQYYNEPVIDKFNRNKDWLGSWSSIRRGNLKNKNEGDIVIINFEVWDELEKEKPWHEAIGTLVDIERVEVSGIFTNVFLGKNYWQGHLGYINQHDKRN